MLLRKIIFVYFTQRFINVKKNLKLDDLNFRRLDFSNYKQIKRFIFKKNFHKLNNEYVQTFDFLNFSQNLGGKIGINLSKQTILNWFILNNSKINFPWIEDYGSKRLINIIYNYEFINSSSTPNETKYLKKIILLHMHRVIFDFKYKNINKISSYDLIANTLSYFILNKNSDNIINYVYLVTDNHLDNLGMHKSYNILEHARYLNNLHELKNIFLYFNKKVSEKFESKIVKMTSILNEYFHKDGTIPLFNGSNNNYTNIIYNSLNKEEYLKSRSFTNSGSGLAFYSDKNKKIFFDVVQPNKNKISNSLSAGTLSFEFSCIDEKIITNCGASENTGKNPEYLRYSAAHSTIILQNTNISEIKENNPHIKFPQSVTFEINNIGEDTVFEGSHNGYIRKFQKVIKRRLKINKNENKIYGEDNIISIKNKNDRTIYHIRFHLMPGIVYNFTNNKKNVILRSKQNSMWLFKCDIELIVEDSILVDNNKIIPTKQIVIKGICTNNKVIRKWSLEKI